MTSLAQNTVLPALHRYEETPLLGRADELTLLQRHLEQTASGRSHVVFIEGEAGIGKSRLLAEALDRAQALGFTTLRGTGDEMGVTRPFGVLADALRPSRPSLERDGVAPDQLGSGDIRGPQVVSERQIRPVMRGLDIPAGLGLSRPPEQPWQFLDASLDLLEELATSTPVLLALEDLHWADPSSLLAIRAIGRHLAAHPISVVCTLRPVPRVPELDRLVDDLAADGATRLVLRPLNEAGVAGLVTSVVGAPPGPKLLTEAAGAAGNPLFVLEWLRALVETAEVEVTSGHAELTFGHREAPGLHLSGISGPSAPPTFARSVLRRLNYLSDATLEALQVAAILGPTFSLTDLSLVTGSPASSLLGSVREALEAGLLEDAGGQLSFRHALVHQAIYMDLPLSVRAGMHQQVGRALATAGASAGQVAHHLARGAGPGDVEAVRWLERAAHEVAAHAPGVGADLLARALEFASPLDPRRPSLLAQRAMALVWSGRMEEGEEAARQALAGSLEPTVEADLRLGLGRALLVQGRGREAVTHLDLGACLSGVDKKQQAQLLAEASLGRLLTGDVGGAVAGAEWAATAGESAGDDLATCAALCTQSMIAHLLGDPARAVACATRAVERADARAGGAVHVRHPRFFLGLALLGADRFAEAKEALQAGRRQAERAGAHWGLSRYHAVMARYRLYIGEWDNAVVEFEAGVAEAEDTGSRALLVWLHATLARLAIHRDDLPAAEDALARAEVARMKRENQFGILSMLWARALVHEALGNADGAVRLLRRVWDRVAASGFVWELRDVGPDLVRLACIVGARDLAQGVTETLEAAAVRAGTPSYEAAGLCCRGVLEENPDVLLAAVGAYRRSCRPFETAMALEQGALALGRAGRLLEAAPVMDEAITTYERLGAVRDVARAVGTLRSLGVRRGRRGPRQRPTTGWASLTMTEQQVVRLVVEGLTNAEVGRRLFISRRTVETHLAHVFTKLGISSRRQLAAIMVDADAAPRIEPIFQDNDGRLADHRVRTRRLPVPSRVVSGE